MASDRFLREDHHHTDALSCPRCRAVCQDFSAGDPAKLSVCKSIFERLGADRFSEQDFEQAMTAAFGDDWRRRAVGAIVHDRMGPLDLSDTVPVQAAAKKA